MDINDAGKETCRVALAEIGAKLEKDKKLDLSIFDIGHRNNIGLRKP